MSIMLHYAHFIHNEGMELLSSLTLILTLKNTQKHGRKHYKTLEMTLKKSYIRIKVRFLRLDSTTRRFCDSRLLSRFSFRKKYGQ